MCICMRVHVCVCVCVYVLIDKKDDDLRLNGFMLKCHDNPSKSISGKVHAIT